MTKTDITIEISKQTGILQADVRRVVQLALDSIIKILEEERRVEFRNFGIFEVKERNARTARNPRTGEAVTVPAKRVVRFKPGKIMKDRTSET